jgi:Zn-dependent protease with chaperone function
MNFFEEQHRARRHTALMAVMFALAVAAIVVSINVVGGTIYLFAMKKPLWPAALALAAVPHHAYWVTSAVVLGAIAWGTLTRTYELSGGGAAVAQMVGAERIKRDAQEPADRRLLNVVEEMALASGVSVPQVYVMEDEHSINAFAAGFSPNEAAVIVTRGTLEQLSRDELQGVVAHEFSHILNGDMRLNIRLLGVISGIVLIGAAGGFLMRIGQGGRGARGDIRIFLIGLLIWLIGSVGVLAGRLIKAMISREREFLADASAVQFTRNPEGIGGALYKIGQIGSAVGQRNAEEISHMCISVPVENFFDFDWFSTHPPIEQRIERVMGPAAVRLLQNRELRAAAAEPRVAAASTGGGAMPLPEALMAMAGGAAASSAPGALRTTPQALLASVGKPSMEHVEAARNALDLIPGEIRIATGSEAGAKAALFALLLRAEDSRAQRLELLKREAGEAVAAQAARFADSLQRIDVRVRMPLLEVAMPTLKMLAAPEREKLLKIFLDLAGLEHRMTLGEFVLLTLCKRHLGPEAKGAPPVRYNSIDAVAAECTVVLSLLAHAGGGGAPAFGKGMAAIGLQGGGLRAPASLDFAAIESALYRLKLLAPLKKPRLVKACLETVMADGKITVAEGELMRAVCTAIDSPLPPILGTELETDLETTETNS